MKPIGASTKKKPPLNTKIEPPHPLVFLSQLSSSTSPLKTQITISMPQVMIQTQPNNSNENWNQRPHHHNTLAIDIWKATRWLKFYRSHYYCWRDVKSSLPVRGSPRGRCCARKARRGDASVDCGDVVWRRQRSVSSHSFFSFFSNNRISAFFSGFLVALPEFLPLAVVSISFICILDYGL